MKELYYDFVNKMKQAIVTLFHLEITLNSLIFINFKGGVIILNYKVLVDLAPFFPFIAE